MTREKQVSRRAVLAAGAAAVILPPRPALADYPDRPITWIVAYAAGGGSDTLARLLAETMAPALGQQLVIENRPGGATNIGASAAAQAAPDGYTVFTADNGTLVFNPALFKKLPYDPARDFRPVGLMARFPLVLAVTLESESTDAKGLTSPTPAIDSQREKALASIATTAKALHNAAIPEGA